MEKASYMKKKSNENTRMQNKYHTFEKYCNQKAIEKFKAPVWAQKYTHGQ